MHAAFDPMLPRSFRVQQFSRETPDTFTMALIATDGSPGFEFETGQFNMVSLPGIGEVPVSISGDPAQPEKLIHTLRAVGAITKAICQVRPGDVVGVRGPFGHGWPSISQLAGHDVLLLAGGLGLAPLRPSMYEILANREKLGRVVLLYGARTPEDLLYTHELEKWRKHFDLQVEISVDRSVRGWYGDVGVITTLIPRAIFDPAKTLALICGPEIMMRFTIFELEKRQLSHENLYVSMERNMECGIGLCGHCQFGPFFLCKNGPVFRFDQLDQWFTKREV